MLGFNVLTLPSKISGKPVKSFILVIGISFLINTSAVPPVDIIWMPFLIKVSASFSTFVLS